MSNSEKISFNKCTVSFGDISSDICVKLTISANITVTSAWPSAMLLSWRFRRSAIGCGRMFNSSRSASSLSIETAVVCASTAARNLPFSREKYQSNTYTIAEIDTKFSTKNTATVRISRFLLSHCST